MTYQQVRIDDPVLRALANGSYILRASLAGRAELTRHVLKAESISACAAAGKARR